MSYPPIPDPLCGECRDCARRSLLVLAVERIFQMAGTSKTPGLPIPAHSLFNRESARPRKLSAEHLSLPAALLRSKLPRPFSNGAPGFLNNRSIIRRFCIIARCMLRKPLPLSPRWLRRIVCNDFLFNTLQ